MPSPEVLERFIARVESNHHAEAIEEFYTADASMQENDAAPRVGRDALVANERKVLARMKSVKSTCVRPVFVSGDRVVVRWIFEFETLDGRAIHMEELAYQRWEGDRVAEEKFFYDPKVKPMLQLRPNCECCDRDLPPESTEAMICSFECTFCRPCVESKLKGRCPNCGGELVSRPRRPAEKLAKNPASTQRIFKPQGCAGAAE